MKKKSFLHFSLLLTGLFLCLGLGQKVSANGYIRPIDNGVITTGFNGYPGHSGVDYAVPTGTPIRAVADGRVKFAGAGSQHSWMTWLAGNCVLIQHSDGKHTGYAHLSTVSVSTGSHVKQGQIIGYSGATGMVTGPHLHFEILPAYPNFQNGRAGRIDPTGYIANAPTFRGTAPVVTQTTQTTTASTGLKIYRVDDLQNINGRWLVRNNALVPVGFDWADNGISPSEIDEVDANGNKTADQVLQRGSYFVFNPSAVRSVGTPLTGTGGLSWASVRFSNGSVAWLRTDSLNHLVYK